MPNNAANARADHCARRRPLRGADAAAGNSPDPGRHECSAEPTSRSPGSASYGRPQTASEQCTGNSSSWGLPIGIKEVDRTLHRVGEVIA